MRRLAGFGSFFIDQNHVKVFSVLLSLCLQLGKRKNKSMMINKSEIEGKERERNRFLSRVFHLIDKENIRNNLIIPKATHPKPAAAACIALHTNYKPTSVRTNFYFFQANELCWYWNWMPAMTFPRNMCDYRLDMPHSSSQFLAMQRIAKEWDKNEYTCSREEEKSFFIRDSGSSIEWKKTAKLCIIESL